MPKLSIITINLNNDSGLRKTMQSVLAQTSMDFEHIIIDGGSADGSLEVIKSFTKIPPGAYTPRPDTQTNPITYWLSEPDTGIFNAMNKGLGKASGEYVHFLNSGDWLADDHVAGKMLEALRPETDILVGEVISVRPDGKVRYNKNKTDVGLSTFYGGTIQHTSAYIRKSLFEKYGLYDETLKIVADWKWYLIAAGLNDDRVQFADIYVSCFDTTGISSTNIELDKAERRQVLEALIPSPILADYDRFYFHMMQIQRMKNCKWLYGLFWFAERCLFKIEKWRLKYFGWKNTGNSMHQKQSREIKQVIKNKIKPVAKGIGYTISSLIQFGPLFSLYNYIYERSPHPLVRFLVNYAEIPKKDYIWEIILLNGKRVKTHIIKDNLKTSQFALSYKWHSRALNHIEAALNEYFPKNVPWIDIGANLGLRSLYALSVNRPVVFIEPNKALNQINEERCLLNNFKNYSFVEKGVSNKTGKLTFYIDQSSYMSTLEINVVKDKYIAGIEMIDVDTLDNLFKQNIDDYRHACVKVDVEGHELKLFEGAENFITRLQPSFIVEVNTKGKHFDAFYEVTQQYNYEVYEIGVFGRNKFLRMIKNNNIESSRLIQNNDFLLINNEDLTKRLSEFCV